MSQQPPVRANSTPDTFTTFVELLADELDHPGDTADLAARMYLSRSHLDRIIRASAGETPGRFKRRIVLERAAYQLLTTDQTVLDVAVDAGYSSHEAFTRSFHRAYGTNPSTWRRAPSQIQLATANQVHFHPPTGIRLPAPRKVTSVELLTRMVEHHIWLIGQLIDHAATLTDDQLDLPIELSVDGVDDHPTLRSVLSRLVGQMDMWNEAIAMRGYDFAIEQGESIPQLHDRLRKVGPVFLGHVRDVLDNGRLDETFVHLADNPPKVYTYGGLIAHVLTFAAYRRTLAVGALTSFGVAGLNNGDPRDWVPDPPAGLLPPA